MPKMQYWIVLLLPTKKCVLKVTQEDSFNKQRVHIFFFFSLLQKHNTNYWDIQREFDWWQVFIHRDMVQISENRFKMDRHGLMWLKKVSWNKEQNNNQVISFTATAFHTLPQKSIICNLVLNVKLIVLTLASVSILTDLDLFNSFHYL